MTGAFLRVKRGDRWENIEVEHLTNEEREKILSDDPRMMQWLNIVCEKLAEAEGILDQLVEEGILSRG